ncbi:MAG: RecX family transcriptional regulator [Alistipes sp.]|nr:RecX family transcriptional regulator [Alistipes sp.]
MRPTRIRKHPEASSQTDPRPKRAKTPDQASAALMRLCARAEKCEGDARRLMRGWGLAEHDIEQVLARLVRERFIDDSRYAGAFVSEKTRIGGWGEYKIRAALQRKGIDRATIDAALAQTDRGEMADRLRKQLERKSRTVRHDTPYELKTKLIRYGLSLGYDYETVIDTLVSLVGDSELCNDF